MQIECAPGQYDTVCANANQGVGSKIYETFNVVGYCIANKNLKQYDSEAAEHWSAVYSAFTESLKEAKFLRDFYLSSRAIYWTMGLSFVYCIIIIYLLSWFAEQIAWGMIIIIQLGLFAGVGAGVFLHNETKAANAAILANNPQAPPSDLKKDNGIVMALVFGIFALLYLCAIVCGRRSLKIAIDVVDASADFLAKTKRLMFVSVFYFVVQMIIISLFLGAMMSVGTLKGDIVFDPNSAAPQARKFKSLGDKEMDKKVNFMFLFLLFGMLWMIAFTNAKTAFVTMVSATTYYFDSNKDKEGDASVLTGIRFTYFYHIGSLAFGSFIIAVIQFIQIMF